MITQVSVRTRLFRNQCVKTVAMTEIEKQNFLSLCNFWCICAWPSSKCGNNLLLTVDIILTFCSDSLNYILQHTKLGISEYLIQGEGNFSPLSDKEMRFYTMVAYQKMVQKIFIGKVLTVRLRDNDLDKNS